MIPFLVIEGDVSMLQICSQIIGRRKKKTCVPKLGGVYGVYGVYGVP
jgi:hypothetical protein